MTDIIAAARLAAQAHAPQYRKYTREPYILHPGRVAARLSWHPLGDEVVVCAAWCHDVLEDCGERYDQVIEVQLGSKVARLVTELTNPSKQHPDLPRAERKAMDRMHLKLVSPEAQLIKLADRADNVRDLCRTVSQDLAFAKLYWEESWALLHAIVGADTELEDELVTALDELDRLTA